jgi:hypothetical protein
MELTNAQRRKIWLVSDTVLYSEAKTFMDELSEQEGWKPLPQRQTQGLLNITRSARSDHLFLYIKNQIARHVHKDFYEKLEQKLLLIQRRRLQEEFQLSVPQPTKQDETAEKKALMLLLAREFIQHLAAENGIR